MEELAYCFIKMGYDGYLSAEGNCINRAFFDTSFLEIVKEEKISRDKIMNRNYRNLSSSYAGNLGIKPFMTNKEAKILENEVRRKDKENGITYSWDEERALIWLGQNIKASRDKEKEKLPWDYYKSSSRYYEITYGSYYIIKIKKENSEEELEGKFERLLNEEGPFKVKFLENSKEMEVFTMETGEEVVEYLNKNLDRLE